MMTAPDLGEHVASSPADVVALIDEALDDWTVSQDAMRWAPKWDEPIVRSPRGFVEDLTTAGWDGYAAQAYPPLAFKAGLRALTLAVEKFGQQMRALAPRFLAAHDAATRKAPPPFWTVQPQRERRTR